MAVSSRRFMAGSSAATRCIWASGSLIPSGSPVARSEVPGSDHACPEPSDIPVQLYEPPVFGIRTPDVFRTHFAGEIDMGSVHLEAARIHTHVSTADIEYLYRRLITNEGHRHRGQSRSVQIVVLLIALVINRDTLTPTRNELP